ncbi:uncharacterized protein N7459_006387 [Penicillium hispanicum]|uniref:uncharacterized protein n=1 Tax=Penicillium hispanicum TaxID=1080232 RepID=UPI002541FDA3|nr:uncharacterized protein N7459_006387 [Penicillium hispanicum]KAJ5577423.1 hypothetical protein N7459_006387 [Penicillium hispanicum]
MAAGAPSESSCLDLPVAKREQRAIFASQPLTFILPTHLTLEQLHDSEHRLVQHGGKLTYDIAEASLILGKIAHKKRAALELRSRGISLEEIPATPESELGLPLKKRKTESTLSTTDAELEIVDLSTGSEDEADRAGRRHRAQAVEDRVNAVTLLQLGWLDDSVTARKAVPQTSYTLLKGWKLGTTRVDTQAKSSPHNLPSRIIERAKEDAASKLPLTTSNRFHSRRFKEPPDEASSQRRPPALFRQTTSEHEETVSPPPQPDWVRDQVLFACMRSAPLHPPNEDFIAQLEKIRRIRELTLDEIGVRAYSTSIAAVAAYPYPIRRPSEVLTLPGCDMKVANLFADFQKHGGCSHTDDDGNVAAADALDTDPVLRVLNAFYKIWGIGAKTARDFFYHRGWRDLDDVVEYGWDSLSRVQQIGIKFYDEFQEGIPRNESETIAATVRQHANLVRPEAGGNVDCIVVGGYRRGKQLSGDVDLILTHHDDAVTRNLVVDIVTSLETEGYIPHTLSLHLTSTLREQQTLPFRGDETGKHFDTLDKALVVWQDPHFDESLDSSDASPQKKNPNPHRRVDIIISPWRTVGCAVLGWSGDTTFQRDLRRYAKKVHGWKFDSSGIRERTSGGQVVDLEQGGNTWEERERLVMEGLGVGWRPPEERCTR